MMDERQMAEDGIADEDDDEEPTNLKIPTWIYFLLLIIGITMLLWGLAEAFFTMGHISGCGEFGVSLLANKSCDVGSLICYTKPL